MGRALITLLRSHSFPKNRPEAIGWVVLLRKFDTKLKDYFEYLTILKSIALKTRKIW